MHLKVIDDFASADIVPFSGAVVTSDPRLVLEFAVFGGVGGGRGCALARFESVGAAGDGG
jgi:hypothetical protein